MLEAYFNDSKESDSITPELRQKIKKGYYSESLTELDEVWQKIEIGDIIKPIRKKIKLLCQLSWLAQKSGQFLEAERYNKIINDCISTQNTSTNSENAFLHLRKGAIHFEFRRLEEAEEETNKAESIVTNLFGKNSFEYLECVNQQAEIFLRKGKYDDSYKLLTQAMLQLDDFKFDDLIMSYPKVLIGRCHLAKGNYKESLAILERCLKIRTKLLSSNHPDVAEVIHRISCLNGHEGDYKSAVAREEKAFQICSTFFSKDHPIIAEILLQKADYHRVLDDMQTALELSNASMNARLKIFGVNNPILSMNYNNIGVIYLNQGHLALALYNFQKSLDLKLKFYGKDHPDVAINHSNIGIILSKQENLDEALKHYTLALRIHKLNRIPNHPYILQSYSDIAWLQLKKRNHKQALESCKQSLPEDSKESYKSCKTTGLSFYCKSTIFKEVGDLYQSLNYNSKARIVCKKMSFEKNHQFIVCLNQNSKNLCMNKSLNSFSYDL